MNIEADPVTVPKVVFIPEIKLYLRVLAIIIDTDGPGTTSNKNVANKKGINEFNFLIYVCLY